MIYEIDKKQILNNKLKQRRSVVSKNQCKINLDTDEC